MPRSFFLALLASGCASAPVETMSFSQAIASARIPRPPKQKREPVAKPEAVPNLALQGALVRFGEQVRSGRNGAPKGAAMPAAQVAGWGAALTGVEAFLATETATMSPFDLVRARVVLEAELEADAALWGDFPKELADRTQKLIGGLKARQVAVNALKARPRSVNWKRFSWPVQPVVITSPFGTRLHPIHGDYKLHKGVDLLAEPAQVVVAPYSGTVVFAGWHGGYGKHVELQHDIEVTTTYSHLMNLMVKEGDVVKKGEVIGLAGDTGAAAGVHLHFELYKKGLPVDPELALPATFNFYKLAEASLDR